MRNLDSSQATAVCLVGAQISDPVGAQERWTEYFEQLYQVNPPTVNLDTQISENPPSLSEVKGAIYELKQRVSAASHEILRLRGITTRIIGLMGSLYTGTESAVKCGGVLLSLLPVSSEVKQGCVLALTLFNTRMDKTSLEALVVALDTFNNEAKPPASRGLLAQNQDPGL
ncbi:uncharacterized protein [Penaeus vannamei]|uniref:uncharacterized protein n=1 Tax=Penaeus vannamei TaxID=6689 RepID=UPI00387F55EC